MSKTYPNMAHMNSVLAVLQDGLWHSEDELCEKADESVSSEVDVCGWLRHDDLDLEHCQGKVRWKVPQIPLCYEQLNELWPKHISSRLDSSLILTIVGSTNDSVKSQPVGTGYALCVAEKQVKGRGRRGQSWLSPMARNLYFSLRYRISTSDSYPDGLSLAVGIAVAKALGSSMVQGVRVKWPNDLYLDDKKLGGVLVEIAVQAGGVFDVVIGIGLNVNMADLEVDVGQPWVSLAHVYGDQDRNPIVAALLTELISVLDTFPLYGREYIQSHWSRFDLTKERPALIAQNGLQLEGVGLGIDEQYRYKFESAGEVMVLDSSDVSLRLL